MKNFNFEKYAKEISKTVDYIITLLSDNPNMTDNDINLHVNDYVRSTFELSSDIQDQIIAFSIEENKRLDNGELPRI